MGKERDREENGRDGRKEEEKNVVVNSAINTEDTL